LIQTLTLQETGREMQQNLWKKKKCIKTSKKGRVNDDVVALPMFAHIVDIYTHKLWQKEGKKVEVCLAIELFR
jgi:hypothetical protein